MIDKTQRLLDKNSYAITRGHDFVEINGVKWATCNLGAESPIQDGFRFVWGSPKIYNAETTRVPLTNDIIRFNEHNRKLSPNNDPARILWGGKWRTPTRNEIISLRKYIDIGIKNALELIFSEKFRAYGRYWVSDKAESSNYPSFFSFFGGALGLSNDLPNYPKFIRPVLDV